MTRVALITGSSSGIGLSTTLQLAQPGWRVVAALRDPGTRAALAARALTGGRLWGGRA